MASNVSIASAGGYAVAPVTGRTAVAERGARTFRGLRMLSLGLAVLIAGIVVLWLASRPVQRAGYSAGRQHRLPVPVTAGAVAR